MEQQAKEPNAIPFYGVTMSQVAKRKRVYRAEAAKFSELLGEQGDRLVEELLPDPESNISKREWERIFFVAKTHTRMLLDQLVTKEQPCRPADQLPRVIRCATHEVAAM
ncbi:unnamed protein product [Symbiodinium sp. CCMP2592]|nr:unnamed protein product [Symbiodinium sp. CCMP2592]